MNDLPLAVDNAEITMYADDTIIYRAFNNINCLTDELIPAFGKICEWLKSDKLASNSLKTEFMIIGTSHRLNKLDSLPENTPYLISINGSYIRRVKQVKYLGLVVDNKLKWEEHIEYISSKIIRNIGVLKQTRAFIPQHSLQTLYTTMIEPYFRYCNIVWGQCNKTLLEKLQTLQNKVARTIASLRYEDANHCKIISQYGWLSVEHLIYYDLGVFMYKTINGLSPAISSFQNVKHIHQTRSATNGNLYISNVNTLAGQRAIPVAGAKLRNEIPTEIRNAESLDTFSSKLKTYYLSQQQDTT